MFSAGTTAAAIRSKTDAEAQGAAVAITPAAMKALYAIRPAGAGGEVKVFGLRESQIARRVKAIAKAAGLADWEFFSGHSGGAGMTRRMAQNGAPTHEIERQSRWKQGGGIVGRYTRGEFAGSALRYLWQHNHADFVWVQRCNERSPVAVSPRLRSAVFSSGKVVYVLHQVPGHYRVLRILWIIQHGRC